MWSLFGLTKRYQKLSDEEIAQQDKRVIQELINQAEHVYIGNSEREGKKSIGHKILCF